MLGSCSDGVNSDGSFEMPVSFAYTPKSAHSIPRYLLSTALYDTVLY